MNTARTHPITQRSVAMNRSQLKKFEIRLGIIQAVSLVAVVLGFLGGAFFLGFSSGKTTGHDLAYQSSIATSARIPLTAKNEKQASTTSSQPQVDVYANLQGIPKVQEQKEKVQEEQKLQVAASADKLKEPEVSNIPEVKIPLEPIEDKSPQKLPNTDTLHNEVAQQPAKHDLLGSASVLDNKGTLNNTAPSTLGDVAPKSLNEVMPLHNEKLTAGADVKGITSKTSQIPPAVDTTVGRVVFSDSVNAAEKEKTIVEKSALNTEVAQKELAQKVSPTQRDELLPKKEEITKQIIQKAEAPKIVEPQKPITSPSTKGWFAQVAAPQKSSDAQQLTSRLRASGFKVTIENATVRGEQYYRVLVGPESSIEQAQRLVEQLKRESYLQTQPFVRLLK